MFKIDSFKIILFLSILNLIVSSYLFYLDLKKEVPFCLINSGCEFIFQSKYSRIFNIPIAFLGIVYFLILLIFSFLIFKGKNYLIKFFKIIITFGFLFALYLIYLQFFVIKSFCQYCLVVDFSTIIMFFLSLKLKNE
ncbi:MAG: hypothetical protein C4348_00645 [Patescibacteria group bacterium]